MFGFPTILAMLICGVFAILIPVAAVIIFKLKYPKTPMSALFAGIIVFIVFALILEQAVHGIMLPIVGGSTVGYIIYGALAAGIFEEIGRFIAFKTVLKSQTDPKTAVMYGLGHGGCEAVLLLGLSMLSGLMIAFSVNSMGLDGFVKLAAAGQPELESAVRTQVEAYAAMTPAAILPPLFERVLAMILHIWMSVLVFEAARNRGKVWLLPVCIVSHALLDVPAAMYQRGVIGLPTTYVLMSVVTPVAVLAAVREFGVMGKEVEAEGEG